MRTLIILCVALSCALFSCVPHRPYGPVVQPDGGVLTSIETINQTISEIRAWGQGSSLDIAKAQARIAAAKEMLKRHAGNRLNIAVENSGWQAIVNRTCTEETTGPSIERMSGGVKWTGIVSCRRQELIEWFDSTIGGGVGESVAQISVPRIVLMPSRIFGEITDFDMTDDEKYCYTAMQNIFLERNQNYEISDYETLIRGWKGAITSKTGNIDLDPSFAIEADVYIRFDINVDSNDPGMIKASCVIDAVFVSVGRTGASQIGNSLTIQDTPANRRIAIRDAAANGIDKVYDGMMRTWANELNKGFYFRIIVQDMNQDVAMLVADALEQQVLGPAPLKLNSFSGDIWDISIYVKKEYATPLRMTRAFNDAVAHLGYKFRIDHQRYHALIYTLERQ